MGVAEARDGEGRVEVLPDLCDYPISDCPGVDPGNGAGVVAALDEDGGPEGGDGLGNESEGCGRVSGSAGEKAHQELVGGRTMEPPLEVGSDNTVHRGHVVRAQGRIEGENHPLITRITVLQSFLRVSQF